MNEKLFKPTKGFIGIIILAVAIAGIIFAVLSQTIFLMIPLILFALFMISGFFVVYPNGSKVLNLFGKYSGTVKGDGFYWRMPFYKSKNISLRARNFDSERVKVNDKLGNPIMISVILVWRVKETFKAAFEVDDYEHFVKVQSDAAVRKMANMYPYDDFDEKESTVTLRSGLDEVNHSLENELSDRLEIAGIEVIEARIGYLAYANEIASAMLKRQQAEAVVAARFKIVEGAVGMVEIALEELSRKNIMHLDDEKKASMVSNLMVVLCSDKDVTPIVNSGTLY